MRTNALARCTVSVACICATLHAGEQLEQKVGELVAKQDLVPLVGMCERALRPGGDAERAELCRTIMRHANRDDVPPVVRGELLTLLGRFGGAECVDFLASLLPHKDPVFHTRAVLALQRNPSEEAATALRKALAATSDPERRAALLHALSLRGDRASLPQFVRDASAAEDAVRTAALLAIARTADEPASALFKAAMKQGAAQARREATEAYLLHADRLAKMGKKREALNIYHELLGEGGAVKAAALLGMARTGGAEELAAILENMAGAERSVINITGSIFDHIPKSGPVVAAVCEACKTAPPAFKARLLAVLGRYGDPAGVSTVLEGTKDADQAVRTAAVLALGQLDDERAAAALVAALAAGKEADAAVKAVGTSPRRAAIADGLIAALPGASARARVALVRALRACPADKVVPALLKAAEDADGAVRSEVFDALRRIGDPSAYPRLVERLAGESDPNVQGTAVNALAALGARIKEPSQRSAPVLASLAAGDTAGRPALLLLLPRISGDAPPEAGLKFVREALSAPDEQVRRAALQAMGDWPDPAPVLDDLLGTAKAEPESAFGLLALRAYIKQVGVLLDKRGAGEETRREIIRRCAQGMAVAAQPAERMGLLSHLGRLPHPEALSLAAGCLDDPRVRKEAVQATWSIASALHKSHPDAVRPALEKIKALTGGDKQWQSRVDQLLKAMDAKQ